MNKDLKKLFDFYKKKDFLKAEKQCKNILKKIKPNFEIYNIYAVILYELKKFDDAIINWKKAIELNTDYFFGYNNLGNVYLKKNEIDKAITNYDKAISIKSDYFEAYHNRGNAYSKINNIKKALQDYNSALAIKYDYVASIKSRNEIYKKQKNFTQALLELDKILIYEPNNINAFLDKADILFDLNKLDEALNNYSRALEIKSEPSFALGNFIHTKTRMCEWNNFEKEILELEKKLQNNIKSSPPYPITTLFDSPELQLNCANLWQNQYTINHKENFKFNIKKNNKIKLGFFSADLRTHAMGHLMVRMFELHDKDKFELHGFYFGPELNVNDILQNRIIKCFDSFNNISLLNDLEASNLAKDKEIDIAIDCMGYTGNDNRFGIFLNRAASIQVNFLGYPGTSGSESMDYIVADRTLISAEDQKYYSEKIIYLPDTYQPNEENKEILETDLSRKKIGLPENKFIFCCFNSHQKINPKMFLTWANILKQKKNSVLWLLKDNQFSEKNLKSFLYNQGLDPERLIFADHVPLNQHLARLKFADLLLDTYPYNAHTSCSDALRMDLPIVTLKGRSFASRVAASLINSIKMSELVTSDYNEYEKLALKISNDTNYFDKIKNKIKQNKKNSNLFNTSVYTKNIEQTYQIIYSRNLKKELPENIEL
mgnify:CR=1 FL=1